MSINLKEANLKYVKGVLKDLNTNRQIPIEKAITRLIDQFDLRKSEAEDFIRLLKEKKGDGDSATKAELVMSAATNTGFHDSFVRFHVKASNSIQVYFRSNRDTLVAVPNTTKADVLSDLVMTENPEVAVKFITEIAPLYTKKDEDEDEVGIDAVTNSTLIAKYFQVAPLFDKSLATEIEEDPAPLRLSTDSRLAMKYLPYTEIPNEDIVLNPTLSELLNRISDHQYLCATLWQTFNGVKTPLVSYLYGRGGDGKSSFILFLSRLTSSLGAWDETSRFSNYHMHGKALIVLAENNRVHIMQNNVLKQVTGSSPVSLERKGGASVTGIIQGNLIIDANQYPIITGESYETRRLRMYVFDQPNLDGKTILTTEAYARKLLEGSNDFINYCRMCFERVGGELDAILPEPPGHKETMKRLRDSVKEVEMRKCHEKLENLIKLKVSPELSCHRGIIEQHVTKFLAGNKFAIQEYERFLRLEYGITVDMDIYKGVGVGVKNG